MKLIIKDVDITASGQSIRSCKYIDYAGGRADALQIVFNDTYDLWRKWGLVKNDKIRVTNDSIDSGDMYISGIELNAGVYQLKALSTPAKSLNEKSWIRENIKLSEIYSEISSELGFDLYSYGINDYLYTYVERINQSPVSYLNSILVREGYLQKIFNNRLIISNEKTLEHVTPLINITIDDFINDPSFGTKDTDIISSVENSYQHEKGTITSKASSGLNGKSKKYNFPVNSIGEGERFCKNIMRYQNKYEFTGSGTISASKITAGVTINLEGDFANWTGTNFVYEVEHNMLFDRQYIKFRKPIVGDY